MKDPKLVREIIAERLDLMGVMIEYDVQFKHDPRHSEETQFRCPFHGSDNKPSARLFRNTNSCYCYFCKKSWDSFSFILEKEGLGFSEGVRFITGKYDVDLSSIPDGPNLSLDAGKKPVNKDVQGMEYIRRRIIDMKRKLPLIKYAAVCQAYLYLIMDQGMGRPVSEHISVFEGKIKEISKGL